MFNAIKIIADDNEQGADANGHDQTDWRAIAKTVHAHHQIDERQKNNQRALDGVIGGAEMFIICFFGIQDRHQKHQQINRQIKRRKKESGKTAAGPAVRFAIDAPVRGDTLGKMNEKIKT